MRRRVDVYGDGLTFASVLARLGYCFLQPEGSDYPPILNAHIIPSPSSRSRSQGAGGDIPVLAFGQSHGNIRSLGFRFGAIAYSPDVDGLDEAAFAALAGVEVWIVDALRYTPHPQPTPISPAPWNGSRG
ncbi:MAG: MBL fold metallo-hydrolase [Rhizomicrobium sp.]